MVLDNYDDPTAFNVQDYISLGAYGSVLITTRHPEVDILANQGLAFQVSGLEESAALDLLFAVTNLDRNPQSLIEG